MPVWDGACQLQRHTSLSWPKSEENKHQIVVFRSFSDRQVVFTGDSTPSVLLRLYFGSCLIGTFAFAGNAAQQRQGLGEKLRNQRASFKIQLIINANLVFQTAAWKDLYKKKKLSATLQLPWVTPKQSPYFSFPCFFMRSVDESITERRRANQ